MGPWHETDVNDCIDDPAASHIVMRDAIRDVGSNHALDLARGYLDECVHGHAHCAALSVLSSDPYLPTRLIDCTYLSHPRLVSTARQRGTYIALSYVWGGDQVHKTTISNMSTYENLINPSLLPATIRDAVFVTHSLGFRYLWVDSLCIIQDSDADKRHEIGRMHHIYRYAYLTIIAASAESVTEGFLEDRPPPPQLDIEDLDAGGEITLPFICPPYPPTSAGGPVDHRVPQQVGSVHLTVYPARARESWAHTRELGHIRTRAWCMQEYLMSPRSLIFTSRTLLFRYQTAMRSVGNSLCDVPDERRIPDALFLPEPPLLTHGSAEWAELHEAWLDIVMEYSLRAASVLSDKLVACAAVAEQFHRALRSDYLAGIWRDTLIHGLLWSKGRNAYNHRPAEYRAPSWSWASVEGDVTQLSKAFLDDNTLAKVLMCEVTLEDAALPFGRVTGGTLVLRAALLRCALGAGRPGRLGNHEMLLQSLQQAQQRQSVGDEDPEIEADAQLGGNAKIDCEEDTHIERMWAVPIIQGKTWVEGLVVAVADLDGSNEGRENSNVSYRRIGYFLCYPRVSLENDVHSRESAARDLGRALKDGEYPSVDIELV